MVGHVPQPDALHTDTRFAFVRAESSVSTNVERICSLACVLLGARGAWVMVESSRWASWGEESSSADVTSLPIFIDGVEHAVLTVLAANVDAERQASLESLAAMIKDELLRIEEYRALLDRASALEREAQASLRKASFYDSITGLFNRSRLDVRLDEIYAAGESGALVLIGLDHFARLNTVRGRDAGDAFLRNVGERLVTRLSSDTFIARIGGDEFALLLPGVHSSQGLLRRLPEIQAALDLAYASERSRLVTSSSIGVALYPADADSSGSVLQAAEMALRQAKENGGNRIEYFAPWLRETVESKLEMLDDVRRGLAANEFLLYYQPICGHDGRARGFEALLRWDHPRSGLLGPYHFLGALEDADLSVTLGLVALRDAITQMREWTDAGVDFGYVAVNLSGAQLAEEELVNEIAALLSRAGVSPHRLMLEVTESVYLDGNRERIVRSLTALRQLGVGLALDDFGTGYASLTHLKELAIDRIKIDRSFMREIASGGGDAAIVRAVITLGHALDLEVVAEGVETVEQLHALRELGCELIQGYHFARPMPAHDATVFCTSRAISAVG